MHPAGGQRGRVREHAAGRAAEPVGGRRLRRRLDPGLRHGHERQQGRHDLVQDQLGDVQLPRRHPAPRLLRRERRADDAGQPHPVRPHVAAAVPDVRHDRADRLRQLVRHALLDGAEHRRVGRLHRAPRAQRHRRRQPDHLRRPRRRRQRRRGRADLGRDLAGVQRLGRQQPLQVHRGVPARRAGRVQGRLQGLLQPAAAHGGAVADVHRGRVPDDPVPRGQRLRRHLHQRRRRQPPADHAAQPQAVHLQRPRRVLVREPADGDGERPRRRRQPRLLQRQRGLLEDPLGVERRRARHGGPDPRLLQGHALHRAPGPGRVDRAPGATRASRRRRRTSRPRTRSPGSRSS